MPDFVHDHGEQVDSGRAGNAIEYFTGQVDVDVVVHVPAEAGGIVVQGHRVGVAGLIVTTVGDEHRIDAGQVADDEIDGRRRNLGVVPATANPTRDRVAEHILGIARGDRAADAGAAGATAFQFAATDLVGQRLDLLPGPGLDLLGRPADRVEH